ncbi:MAG: hypothetical protein ACXU8N_22150 [Telluria sp.]
MTMTPRLFTFFCCLILAACGGGGGGGNDASPAPSLGGSTLSSIPAAQAQLVASGNGKLVFYTAGATPALHIYDLRSQRFTGHAAVSGYAPTAFAYVPAHARVYAGDATGKIHCYGETGQECSSVFATAYAPVKAMTDAGNYLIVQGPADTAGYAIYAMYGSTGAQASVRYAWIDVAPQFSWNASQSRLYFLDQTGLESEVIDQSTGARGDETIPINNAASTLQPPIRVNAAGTLAALGSGDIIDIAAHAWSSRLGAAFDDAAWLADGSLATVKANADSTVLSHYTVDRVKIEEITFNGKLLGMALLDGVAQVVMVQGGQLVVTPYQPSDDGDHDGVPYPLDKFPLDKTAAVDSDNDGYPDAFLGTYTAADSPTGLTLDAYPHDAACHAAAQGDGGKCTAAAGAAIVPDLEASDGVGGALLFDRAGGLLYHWSEGGFLPTFRVGLAAPLSTIVRLAYVPAQGRAYLAYSNGLLTYVDVGASGAETVFTRLPSQATALGDAGNYLLVQTTSTQALYDRNGAMTDTQASDRTGAYFTWNAAQSRLYYASGEPEGAHYLNVLGIDQGTGRITSQASTAIGGLFFGNGPVRVSPDNSQVELYNGEVRSTADLSLQTRMDLGFIDAQWLADGSFVTLLYGTGGSTVNFYNPALVKQRSLTLAGTPVALLRTPAGAVAITVVNGKAVFTPLTSA